MVVDWEDTDERVDVRVLGADAREFAVRRDRLVSETSGGSPKLLTSRRKRSGTRPDRADVARPRKAKEWGMSFEGKECDRMSRRADGRMSSSRSRS